MFFLMTIPNQLTKFNNVDINLINTICQYSINNLKHKKDENCSKILNYSPVYFRL